MADYKVIDATQLDADLTIVADAIREKGGTTEQLEFPLGMKSAVESIPTGGVTKPEQEKTISISENGTTEVIPDSGKVLSKVTVNVAIESGGGSGDNLLQYATFRNGAQIFHGVVFPENYHLNFRIKGNDSRLSFAHFFAYCNAKEITVGIDIIPTDGVNLQYSFGGNSKLTNINFINSPIIINVITNTFNGCLLLKTINGILDVSGASDFFNAFQKCYALEDVRFVEGTIKKRLTLNDCPLLSNESIQYIIDGLATVEASQTLIFHADIKAKLTEAQLTQITSKNWTLA